MRPLLVVKTGRALAGTRARRGDFHQWIAAAMGWTEARFRVVEVHEEAPLPEPGSVAGVVVTGSPAMVSDRAPWSVRAGEWLAGAVAARVPLLAICYGHQLLAEALGGRVGMNPRGREMGTREVELVDGAGADPLFGTLPRRFAAHTTHLESVLELPSGARRLAANPADPHQAYAVGERAWGVQFHPEFDADVMRGYLGERREVLAAEGLDPDRLLREVRECPESAGLLRRFGELVEASERG
jgi:GMP synthase (glutamine-hydrolysing)